jgi:hypothetical protein
MPNHNEWIELSIVEKIDLVGKLTHLLQNELEFYNSFKKHISVAEELGLFNEVKINNEGNS